MPDFLSVAKVGDIPEGEGRAFPVNGRLIAIFYVDGEYSAVDDICPHMGASLSVGHVEDKVVTCPWHAWRFCIKEGTWSDNPNSKLKLDCFQVRIEGEDIQLEVPNAPDQPSKSSE